MDNSFKDNTIGMYGNFDDYVPPKKDTVLYNPSEGKNLSQRKCPACGATDIFFNVRIAKLVCNFCKKEFGDENKGELSLNKKVSELRGRIVALGAANIETCDSLVTLKCTSCGAEVTLDQGKSHQTKCHWCRNILSINNQIPNGTIPDIIVPFSVSKEEAYVLMKKFMSDKRKFAKFGFKRAFKKNAIMGVYFPYMIVDINSHIKFKGQGEESTVRFQNDIKKANEVYNARLYDIEREYDLYIDNLIIESSLNKLFSYGVNTNNIINSILPFDISKAVPWDANYVSDYTVEKRDANINDVEPSLRSQIKDIARHYNLESIKFCDRGVRWDEENVDMTGDFWQAAYLPVWLFTYLDKKDSNQTLHYIAVNAQTRETMGSIPYSKKGVDIIYFIIFALLLALLFTPLGVFIPVLLIIWAVSYFTIGEKYRNAYARHKHEKETKYTVDNMSKTDTFVKELRNLPSSKMESRNHQVVKGNDM